MPKNRKKVNHFYSGLPKPRNYFKSLVTDLIICLLCSFGEHIRIHTGLVGDRYHQQPYAAFGQLVAKRRYRGEDVTLTGAYLR